jgi:rubredoxin
MSSLEENPEYPICPHCGIHPNHWELIESENRNNTTIDSDHFMQAEHTRSHVFINDRIDDNMLKNYVETLDKVAISAKCTVCGNVYKGYILESVINFAKAYYMREGVTRE